MSRIEKDQSGIELMNSVKGEFVNLSEELTDDAVSIEDIDEVLQTLERANIVEAETEEPLIEETSSSVETDEALGEEVELDLSAGEMDKTSDPIRVYMREMGVVPLLTREQEVSIAKRIERGQKRAEKAIARSPIDRKTTPERHQSGEAKGISPSHRGCQATPQGYRSRASFGSPGDQALSPDDCDQRSTDGSGQT